MTGLVAEGVHVTLSGRHVLRGVDLAVPHGSVSAIIGPNGCGKSTLLRSLARIVPPNRGRISLDGEDIRTIEPRRRARRIGFLPQMPQAPEGIRVRALVARGRTPHQGRFGLLSRADHAAVDRALALVGLDDLAERRVDRLSGGQRQRAWIALALAQETDILLLDEPTTFLDPPHQIEILRLVRRLQADLSRTVVAVLHDINLASLYADVVIGMSGGKVRFATKPFEPLSAEHIQTLFGMDLTRVTHPDSVRPAFLPNP